MGFLVGVVGELDRIEDREERRREFMATLLEKRKNTVIPTLMERLNEQKEDLAERRERVRMAQTLGLSKKAAAVLESSGALGIELERLVKLNEDGELNREALKRISEQILDAVPEEKVSDALDYVIKGDLKFSKMGDENDTLIAAMYNATSIEEFTQAYSKAITPLQTETVKRIRPFDYTTRGAKVMDPSKRSSAQTTIAKSIADSLGVAVNTNDRGEFVGFQGEDKDKATTVLNNALDRYQELYESPTYFDDPTKIINEIGRRVNVLRQKGLDINQISQNPYFDLEFEMPDVTIDPNETMNNPNVQPTLELTPDVFDEGDLFNSVRLNN